MRDPKFRKYHCHFTRPSEGFDSSLYDCGYYEEEEADTLLNDSIDDFEDILFDENGEPIAPIRQGNTDDSPVATPSDNDDDFIEVVEM